VRLVRNSNSHYWYQLGWHGELAESSQNLTAYLAVSDLLAIDGISRNLCVNLAAQLSPLHALIILDNSDRVECALDQEILMSRGRKAMECSGLGPLNLYQWQTTVFSR
jgi:hypothetical protein